MTEIIYGCLPCFLNMYHGFVLTFHIEDSHERLLDGKVEFNRLEMIQRLRTMFYA